VTALVPAGVVVSNLWSPSRSQSIFLIGRVASAGVDVDVSVTGVRATTGFGDQSKSAVGCARATPTPSGDTTAPTVAKQAVSRSLT
jgi:hypothetical protein